VAALDPQLARVRAVKSPYEISILERAGRVHRQALEEHVPALLREGMSEAELGCELFSLMVRQGYQGLARFAMFGVEAMFGLFAFGENSLYYYSVTLV
jgi:Xaa-Pro aminopeptidase